MIKVFRILRVFVICLPWFATSALAYDGNPYTCVQNTGGWDFSLRSSFNDLGPLSCPRSFLSAEGATVSAADNLATGQKSAPIVDGLAAVDYRFRGSGDFHGFAVGGYFLTNDTYIPQPTSSQAQNGYTLTPGGFAEVAFDDPFTTAALGQDDIRFRGGEAYSSTGTRSSTFVGEWIPAYDFRLRNLFPINIGVPQPLTRTSPFWYTLSPELMVQYDHLDGGPNKYLIFSSRDEDFRIGPQVILLLVADPNKLPPLPPIMHNLLANSSVSLTNHESWDAYTGKPYSWTAVSATYTIPQTIFGVTGSLGYGNSEATGNKTAQIKIGLAIKH